VRFSSITLIGSTALPAIPVCGDGRIEILSSTTDFCKGVRSDHPGTQTGAELCEWSDDSKFGRLNAGCGTATACGFDKNTTLDSDGYVANQPNGVAAVTGQNSSELGKQLAMGALTANQLRSHYRFDGSLAGSAYASICKYSDIALDANGSVTTNLNSMEGCRIDPATFTTYPSLAHCLNTGPTSCDVSHGGTDADLYSGSTGLDIVGGPLADNSGSCDNYQLHGHKCLPPPQIKTSVAVKPQSWADQIWNPLLLANASQLLDVCLTVHDTAWPSVLPSSNEYVAQRTRMTYEVCCDPIDQFEAFPDAANDCDVYISRSSNKECTDADNDCEWVSKSSGHRCTRFAQQQNPCDPKHLQWELMSCTDGGNCDSLTGYRRTLHNRFAARDASTTYTEGSTTFDMRATEGVCYRFEHDADGTADPFDCADKSLNNTALKEWGYLSGDLTEAASDYICKSGPSNTPCSVGEAAHYVDTCVGNQDKTVPIGTLQHRSKLANYRYCNSGTKECQATSPPGLGLMDCNGKDPSDPGTDDACKGGTETSYKTWYDREQEVLHYKVGCNKKLKFRADYGVHGSMVLRVNVEQYSTSVDTVDPTVGYVNMASGLSVVTVNARTKPINSGTDAKDTGYTGPLGLEEGGSVKLGSDSATHPFASAAGHANPPIQGFYATASRAQFSRSTKAYVELIECTTPGTDRLRVEGYSGLPRFRLDTVPGSCPANEPYCGDLEYNGTAFASDPINPTFRLYQQRIHDSSEMMNVETLNGLQFNLTLRSLAEIAANNGSFWKNPNTTDAWHHGYSPDHKLCLQTRVVFFEPSTCEAEVYVSPQKQTFDAEPQRNYGLTVAMNQPQRVWSEDATVPLELDLTIPDLAKDSELFFVSKVEIHDEWRDGNSDPANYGCDYDIFSYGQTVMATGADSDQISSTTPGAGKSGQTWTSYANNCTRWLAETSASATTKGWLSDGLSDVAVAAGFSASGSTSAVQACLDHARRADIWSTMKMRFGRKCTKNIKLRATVTYHDFAVGGSPGNTSTATLELAAVPRSTRYDQDEVTPSFNTIAENQKGPISLVSTLSPTGLTAPKPLLDGQTVCTYTSTSNDEYESDHAKVPDRDKVCTVASGCSVVGGYRETCEAVPSDISSQTSLINVVVFDESESVGSDFPKDITTILNVTYQLENTTYGPNDGEMTQPEQVTYQPAGNNPNAERDVANKTGQWYRVEACNASAAGPFVVWCDSGATAANGRYTTGTSPSITANETAAIDLCDLSAAGEAFASINSSTSVANQVAQLGNYIDQSVNYWHVPIVSGALPAGGLCVQGLSHFNTEGNNPINLRLVASYRQQLVLDPSVAPKVGGPTGPKVVSTAVSQSNKNQGAFNAIISSERQIMTTSLERTAWNGDTAHPYAVATDVALIEESVDKDRLDVLTPGRIWGNLSTSLRPHIDCPGNKPGSDYCLTRMRHRETTPYHDQHPGRVQLDFKVRNRCHPTQSGWQDAGGLVDVLVDYTDDYQLGGGLDSPGSGTFRVSDEWRKRLPLVHGALQQCSAGPDAVCLIVSQTVTVDGIKPTGDGYPNATFSGGESLCDRMLGSTTDHDQARRISCHVHTGTETVYGQNTFSWTTTRLHSMLGNTTCPRNGTYVDTSTCAQNGLQERTVASNIVLKYPEAWSNCIEFKTEMRVLNMDRDASAASKYAFGTSATTYDFASAQSASVAAIQPVAQVPYVFVDPDLTKHPDCLGMEAGTIINGTDCTGQTGVAGVEAGTYSPISTTNNLTNDGGNLKVHMVAGYQTQVRMRVGSCRTDRKEDTEAPLRTRACPASMYTGAYAWDPLRAAIEPSGERVYIEIESKRAMAYPGSENQHFCVWGFPIGSDNRDKKNLVRYRGMGEDYNETTLKNGTNANTPLCTADDVAARRCDSTGHLNGTFDKYGLDTSLVGCSSYDPNDPNRPRSLYSIRANDIGSTQEFLKGLYFSYPADQTMNDLIEVRVCSRQDWQLRGAGWQCSVFNMDMLVAPAVTLSQVGFNVLSEESFLTCQAKNPPVGCCDADQPNEACPTGRFGAPLQSSNRLGHVSGSAHGYQVSLSETQLHGKNPGECKTNALSFKHTATCSVNGTCGSGSLLRGCGARLPVRFPNQALRTILGIRVSANISTSTVYSPCQTRKDTNCLSLQLAEDPDPRALSTAELAEGLMFVSTGYSQDAMSQCTAAQLDGTMSASGGMSSSQCPANQMAKSVGQTLDAMELILVGRDDNPSAHGDYSLNNTLCERDRQFVVSLLPDPTGSDQVVKQGQNSLMMTIEDDDNFGQIALGYLSGSLIMVPPIAGSLVLGRDGLLNPDVTDPNQYVSLSKWKEDGVSQQTATAFLVRSRLATESIRHGTGMRPMIVRIKLDAGSMLPSSYVVKATQTEQRADETIVELGTYSGESISSANGVFEVNLAGFDACAGPGLRDCTRNATAQDPYPSSQCDCTSGVPAGQESMPFQWVKLELAKADGADETSCGTSNNETVSFSVESVVYDAASAGSSYAGQSITCPDYRAVARPGMLGASGFTSSVTIYTSVGSQGQQIADTNPFRLKWAGLSEADEAGKAAPLGWDGRTYGSTGESPLAGATAIQITETEHTKCDSSNTAEPCTGRSLRMYFCAESRDSEMIDAGGSAIARSGTYKNSFFVDVKDNVATYAQVGDKYALSCPVGAGVISSSGLLNNANGGRANTFGPVSCRAYSQKNLNNTVPVPCDGLANLIADLKATGSLLNAAMATPLNAEELADTSMESAQVKIGDLHTEFCTNADGKPHRLRWDLQAASANDGSLWACPTDRAAFALAEPNLPFVTLSMLPDGNEINLSRRFELQMQNGRTPAGKSSCTEFGRGLASGAASRGATASVHMRVADDEAFVSAVASEDRDVHLFEANFTGSPSWDSTEGKLKISVTDRYFDAGHERTLVNIGFGACPADLDTVWSSSETPVAASTGTCDFLDSALFGGPLYDSQAKLYDKLFNANQPTADVHIAGTGLFHGDRNSVLFTAPRNPATGATWTHKAAIISNRGNSDLSTRGFTATFSATLEQMQACMNSTGASAVQTRVSSVTGQTEYEFSLSVTHVVSSGNPANKRMVPRCVDQTYTLLVGNQLSAMSGFHVGGGVGETDANYIYVEEMKYADQTCASCVGNLGPEHSCGIAEQRNQEMEYTVHLDMADVTRLVSTTNGVPVDMTTYYVVDATSTATSQVQVHSDNCYGAQIDTIQVDTSLTDYTRSVLTFKTGCLGLKNAAGVTQADVFANCANAAKSDTDYSFRVRLWECTDSSYLSNPSGSDHCARLPEWTEVQIAMAFIEQPDPVRFDAPFTKLFQFYRGADSRGPTGFRSGTDLDNWRAGQTLLTNASNPVVTYPSDAYLTASLGFKAGSPLEATMTTAIDEVRLCEFKQPCSMAGYVPADHGIAGLATCSVQNTVTDGTHSPLVLYASNRKLAASTADPGCADTASSKKCPVAAVKTTGAGLPYLTCDQLAWEDWVLAEATAVSDARAAGTLIDNRFGSQWATMPELISLLSPVKSGQLLISDGCPTPFARSMYGDGEPQQTQPGNDSYTDGTRTFSLFPYVPSAPEGSTLGVATGKGVQAYHYQNSSGQHEFRACASRKVVYTAAAYSGDKTALDVLNTLALRVTPPHSGHLGPVSSVDTFMVGVGLFPRNVDRVIELHAKTYATAAAGSIMDANQFNLGGRRLLATDLKARAHAAHAAASRHTLSTLVSIHDVMSTQALMPQGPPQYTQADPAEVVASAAVGGFVVVGPAVDAIPEVQTEDLQRYAFEGIPAGKTQERQNMQRWEKALVRLIAVNVDMQRSGHDWFDWMTEPISITWRDFPERFGDMLSFFFPFGKPAVRSETYDELGKGASDPTPVNPSDKDPFERAFGGGTYMSAEGFYGSVGLLPFTIFAMCLLQLLIKEGFTWLGGKYAADDKAKNNSWFKGGKVPIEAAAGNHSNSLATFSDGPADNDLNNNPTPGTRARFYFGTFTDSFTWDYRKYEDAMKIEERANALVWWRDGGHKIMSKGAFNNNSGGFCHVWYWVCTVVVILLNEAMLILSGSYMYAAFLAPWVGLSRVAVWCCECGSFDLYFVNAMRFLVDYNVTDFVNMSATKKKDAMEAMFGCLKGRRTGLHTFVHLLMAIGLIALRLGMIMIAPMFWWLSVMLMGLYIVIFWIVMSVRYRMHTMKHNTPTSAFAVGDPLRNKTHAPTSAEKQAAKSEEHTPFNV
jgi:hypothetical protein